MKVAYTAIVLGSPAADCAKFGICQVDLLSLDAWEGFAPQHSRHVKAELSFARKNRRLRFEFPYCGMWMVTRRLFFTPEGFQIDTPGYLPPSVAFALGIEAMLILPGLYTLNLAADRAVLEVDTGKKMDAQVVEAVAKSRACMLYNG